MPWQKYIDTVKTVVTEEGVVQAVSSGSAVITAKATSGKTGTYQITVNPSPQKFKISANRYYHTYNRSNNQKI